MRLRGKIALITGGSKGIGKATAALFYKEGASVIIAGRNEEELRLAKNKIEKKTHRNVICACRADLTQSDDVKDLIKRVIEEFGRIDVLVNNVGTNKNDSSVTGVAEKDWDKIFETNLKTVYYVSREVIPHMIKFKSGSIVNVSSILGIRSCKNMSAYSASKGALVSLTKSMAADYSEFNIRVNCVCPSSVATDMLSNVFNNFSDSRAAIEVLKSKHPLRKIGKPADIAYGILYLSSSESNWITGTTLIIDGGVLNVL